MLPILFLQNPTFFKEEKQIDANIFYFNTVSSTRFFCNSQPNKIPMYKQYFRKHIEGYWNVIKSYSQNTPQCLMLFVVVALHRSAKVSSKSLDCLPSHSQVIIANNRLVIKWAILSYVFFHIGQIFFYSYATLFLPTSSMRSILIWSSGLYRI